MLRGSRMKWGKWGNFWKTTSSCPDSSKRLKESVVRPRPTPDGPDGLVSQPSRRHLRVPKEQFSRLMLAWIYLADGWERLRRLAMDGVVLSIFRGLTGGLNRVR